MSEIVKPIDTIFYYVDTLEEYTRALERNEILSRVIVFVDSELAIYKNGKIYGSYKKAVELIDDLADEVRNAMEESERELDNLIAELRELVRNDFLEEMENLSRDLEEYENRLDRLREEFDGQTIEVGEAYQTIDSLNAFIEEYASWKTSLEGTLTTFRNTIDALSATMTRFGERLDTINNQVTNFQEIIDLQNQTFQQYMENYDITNKVKDIIGREIELLNGLLHDFATHTDLDNRVRNSVDTWFNSLDPSWTLLTSRVTDTETAMSGFTSRITTISNGLNDLGIEVGTVKALAVQFASWLDLNSDAVAALITAAGDDSAYFDLMAKFNNLSDADGKTIAARIFGYANAAGSEIVLLADRIRLTTTFINAIGADLVAKSLSAGDDPSNRITINGTDGIRHSGGAFQINIDGSGYFGNNNTKISWDSSGNITLAGLTVSGEGSASSGSGTEYAYLSASGISFTSGNNTVSLTNTGLKHTRTGQNNGGFYLNIDGSGYLANNHIYWDTQGNINIGGNATINNITIKGSITNESTWGGYGISDFFRKAELGSYEGTFETGYSETIAAYVARKIAAAQLGENEVTNIEAIVTNYLDNSLDQIVNDKLSDYVPINDMGTYLNGYQTKEGLLTELSAKLYDANGNVIGDNVLLGQALSNLKKMTGVLMEEDPITHELNVIGLVASNELSSLINNYLENNVAYSGLLTWATSVKESASSGFSLSALIGALLDGSVEESNLQASITGLVDTETLRSELIFEADEVTINSDIISAINSLLDVQRLNIINGEGNVVANITPNGGRISFNRGNVTIPTFTKDLNGNINNDSTGIIILDKYGNNAYSDLKAYYQHMGFNVQDSLGSIVSAFSADSSYATHVISYNHGSSSKYLDIVMNPASSNPSISVNAINYNSTLYIPEFVFNMNTRVSSSCSLLTKYLYFYGSDLGYIKSSPAGYSYTEFNDTTNTIKTFASIINLTAQTLLGGSGTIEFSCGLLKSNIALQVVSDINLKNILSYAEASIEDIANVRVVNYELKSNAGKAYLGSIAQDWLKLFPNAINITDEQGHLGMDYGSIALASSVMGAREIVKLKEENSELKLRIAALEAKLENI